MLTMHPTLLIGPYDWDSQRLPESEFRERIEAFWEKIPDSTISRAIVYGDSRNHAELMYWSNFLPKLGPGTPAGSKEQRTDAAGFRRAKHAFGGATDDLDRNNSTARRPRQVCAQMDLSDCGNPSGAQSQQQILLIGGEFMRGALYKSISEVFAPQGSLTRRYL